MHCNNLWFSPIQFCIKVLSQALRITQRLLEICSLDLEKYKMRLTLFVRKDLPLPRWTATQIRSGSCQTIVPLCHSSAIIWQREACCPGDIESSYEKLARETALGHEVVKQGWHFENCKVHSSIATCLQRTRAQPQIRLIQLLEH